jgi:hypothetical protein
VDAKTCDRCSKPIDTKTDTPHTVKINRAKPVPGQSFPAVKTWRFDFCSICYDLYKMSTRDDPLIGVTGR